MARAPDGVLRSGWATPGTAELQPFAAVKTRLSALCLFGGPDVPSSEELLVTFLNHRQNVCRVLNVDTRDKAPGQAPGQACVGGDADAVAGSPPQQSSCAQRSLALLLAGGDVSQQERTHNASPSAVTSASDCADVSLSTSPQLHPTPGSKEAAEAAAPLLQITIPTPLCCGHSACVCGSECLAVHAVDPPLPSGWHLVVRRAERSAQDCDLFRGQVCSRIAGAAGWQFNWKCDGLDSLLSEDAVGQPLMGERAGGKAGVEEQMQVKAAVMASLDHEVFAQHLHNVKAFLQKFVTEACTGTSQKYMSGGKTASYADVARAGNKRASSSDSTCNSISTSPPGASTPYSLLSSSLTSSVPPSANMTRSNSLTWHSAAATQQASQGRSKEPTPRLPASSESSSAASTPPLTHHPAESAEWEGPGSATVSQDRPQEEAFREPSEPSGRQAEEGMGDRVRQAEERAAALQAELAAVRADKEQVTRELSVAQGSQSLLRSKMLEEKMRRVALEREQEAMAARTAKLADQLRKASTCKSTRDDLVAGAKKAMKLDDGAGLVSLVESLGVDVDAVVPQLRGRTLLHLACEGNKQLCCRALLEAKADPNVLSMPYRAENAAGISGPVRRCPLHVAVLYRNHSCMEELLSSPQISVNDTDSDGRTPLHLAALHSDEQAIEALLSRNGDANAQDRWGKTAVHLAHEKMEMATNEVIRDSMNHGADSRGMERDKAVAHMPMAGTMPPSRRGASAGDGEPVNPVPKKKSGYVHCKKCHRYHHWHSKCVGIGATPDDETGSGVNAKMGAGQKRRMKPERSCAFYGNPSGKRARAERGRSRATDEMDKLSGPTQRRLAQLQDFQSRHGHTWVSSQQDSKYYVKGLCGWVRAQRVAWRRGELSENLKAALLRANFSFAMPPRGARDLAEQSAQGSHDEHSNESDGVGTDNECGEEDGLDEMFVGSGLFNGQESNGYDSSGLEESEMTLGHVPNSIGVGGFADARTSDVAPPAVESIDTPAGSLAPYPA